MKLLTQTETIFKEETVSKLQDVGFLLLRYGLVLVIVWIGAMKATEYEATNIERLIAHSPLLSWGYSIWTVRQFSVLIGAAELIIATLITLRHWSPRACAIGSAGAVLMFVTTLTFLFSTPGWEPTLGGFPVTRGVLGFYAYAPLVTLSTARLTRRKRASMSNTRDSFRCADLRHLRC